MVAPTRRAHPRDQGPCRPYLHIKEEGIRSMQAVGFADVHSYTQKFSSYEEDTTQGGNHGQE